MIIEEVIKELKEYEDGLDLEYATPFDKAILHAIKALEQEPRWIPVSEKLPDKTGWYLVTFKTYDGGYAVSELSYRKPENYWTDKDISKKVFDNNEITAWMPLPKAYSGVE